MSLFKLCDVIQNNYGYCHYSFEENYVHIYNLHVFPKFRRQGKARELLQMTIDEIRKTGYKGKIQIVANPTEKDGISLEKLRAFYKNMDLEVFEYYG